MLSFVVPTFNRPTRTRRCLESIVTQIESDDVEIVVVDDGSTDGTFDALSDYAQLLNCCVTQHGMNRGVTAAKNTGARLSRGAFVAFLDSDDVLAPGGLARIRELIEDAAAPDILFFGTVTRDGKFLGGSCEPGPPNGLGLSEILVRWHEIGEYLPVCRRTSVLAQPYDEALRGFEGLTYLRHLRNGSKLRILPHPPVRLYDDDSSDRLCDRRNMIARAPLLAAGNRILLAEFGADLRRFNPRLHESLVVRGTLYARLAGVEPPERPGGARLRTQALLAALRTMPTSVVRHAYRHLA